MSDRVANDAADAALDALDTYARRRALDIGHSFLVQAPAGSGKTGLLIQRFLALLAHVDRPERIVAMTFTRKAAAEMRERVLAALREAAANTALPPGEHNSQITRTLALAALAQDERHGWQLLAQPSRLRMLTIDGLATALTRQTPVTSGVGAVPAFVDDASALYVQAVRAALSGASPDDAAAWRVFLARLDNDADRAVELLASLLARRDQWLRLPLRAPRADLRRPLEQALRAESERALDRVRGMFPVPMRQRIASLATHAAAHSPAVAGEPSGAEALALLAARGGVPEAAAEALDSWRVLADFLLTNKGSFRLIVTRNDGFPPPESGPGAAQRGAARDAMLALLNDARSIPGLEEALRGVRVLPPPAYDAGAWEFIDATLSLLPLIASHLLMVFAAEGAADFGEATLRALAALGNAEDPGELLLAVDYQLAHLLVDEFQDTSWTHRELIARLTSGWEAGDGRTLFAVGDPMQSIYRFREAEVGIFLDAQATSRVAGIRSRMSRPGPQLPLSGADRRLDQRRISPGVAGGVRRRARGGRIQAGASESRCRTQHRPRGNADAGRSRQPS